MGVTELKLGYGDRKTFRIPIERSDAEQPAAALQFRVGADGTWTTVNPDDASVSPAEYRIRVAYGPPAAFPTAHPVGTITVLGSCEVKVRPASGDDIDAEPAAMITVG